MTGKVNAMAEVDRWNWFMSADISGKWIITDGYADVTYSDDGKLLAVLRHAPDADPYTHVVVDVDDANAEHGGVTAVVTGRDADPYTLHGTLYTGDKVMSVILTDGTTVLGLAFGPESHKRNLS